MAVIPTSEGDLADKLRRATAGDVIQLVPGEYNKPIFVSGIRGTSSNPIIIETKPNKRKKNAVFSSDVTTAEFRLIANGVADKRQNSGYYPSVGQIADEAMLTLENCQYVIIRNMAFHGCWPGAIYMDDCQHIVIDTIDFKEGTIAIGANGLDTRNILVQNCDWVQDISSKHDMWNKIPWGRIHGASNNENNISVDIKGDYRHWDGDFFRGWDVAGNITLRGNTISDAFNGIHFFNRIDKLPGDENAAKLQFNGGRRSTTNILIEHNSFTRVRDNCVEPEYYAWNWVVRHNRFLDCFRPFSFELDRAGWFYVYGNTGAFVRDPSSIIPAKDAKYAKRQTMSLFKLGGAQRNEGRFYVFNNSWYYKRGKGLFPKFRFAGLEHFNNAVHHEKPENGRTFGKASLKPSAIPFDPDSEFINEQKRFTRRWDEFEIRFDGDVINDNYFPHAYKVLGYSLGNASKDGDPKFKNFDAEDVADLDFTLKARSPATGKSISWVLDLPNAQPIVIPANFNVGAAQKTGVYAALDSKFNFLTEEDWYAAFAAPKKIV